MANQVLSDVVATALGRWRHGFDWILRGYTYEARVPPGVGVADGGERCALVRPTSATSSGSDPAVANEPNLAADSEQAGKQNPALKPRSVPKVNMISAMSKLHSKAIADELDEALSAGCIAAGIPPTAV